MGRVLGSGGIADARGPSALGYPVTASDATTQVITPRRTRLVRVPDLHAFRAAIVTLASGVPDHEVTRDGGTAKAVPYTSGGEDPFDNRRLDDVVDDNRVDEPFHDVGHPFRGAAAIAAGAALAGTAVVVPTRGAAHQLRRSLGDRLAIVTRDELYDLLHARLENPPRRLTPLERDVLAQAAARAAAATGLQLSFRLRPGLIAEMLRFYDHLRRQSQQVDRFEELIDQALGSDDLDRAAARMRVQTRFLAAAFGQYERRVRDSDGCDEHALREQLMAEPARDPLRHVIVTVADWIADDNGLFSADFDMLTRLPGLETLDIVCTERILESGFHERLHNWWPGMEEAGFGTRDSGFAKQSGFAKPVLMTPPVDARSANPDRTNADRANPDGANPEHATRDRANLEHARPEHANPESRTPNPEFI